MGRARFVLLLLAAGANADGEWRPGVVGGDGEALDDVGGTQTAVPEAPVSVKEASAAVRAVNEASAARKAAERRGWMSPSHSEGAHFAERIPQ